MPAPTDHPGGIERTEPRTGRVTAAGETPADAAAALYAGYRKACDDDLRQQLNAAIRLWAAETQQAAVECQRKINDEVARCRA